MPSWRGIVIATVVPTRKEICWLLPYQPVAVIFLRSRKPRSLPAVPTRNDKLKLLSIYSRACLVWKKHCIYFGKNDWTCYRTSAETSDSCQCPDIPRRRSSMRNLLPPQPSDPEVRNGSGAAVVGPFSRRRHWDPLADVARTRSRRNLHFRFRPDSEEIGHTF